eukprot:1387958-Amorphochlora_amoeboformis.AAC.3
MGYNSGRLSKLSRRGLGLVTKPLATSRRLVVKVGRESVSGSSFRALKMIGDVSDLVSTGDQVPREAFLPATPATGAWNAVCPSKRPEGTLGGVAHSVALKSSDCDASRPRLRRDTLLRNAGDTLRVNVVDKREFGWVAVTLCDVPGTDPVTMLASGRACRSAQGL